MVRFDSYRAASLGNRASRNLEKKSTIGGRATLQAVTRVKLEQASKATMWMPTRRESGEGRADWEEPGAGARYSITVSTSRATGVLSTACKEGSLRQWGRPGVVGESRASNVIFQEATRAERRQAGCVRFSYIALRSRTPRRYRCQPDLALEGITDAALEPIVKNRLRPSYTSIHYGDPDYAQLALECACEIKIGAENGAEMGAFNLLLQPQREANLRIRLDEYLPFGLEPGLIYLT